jgi:hypothetical protein
LIVDAGGGQAVVERRLERWPHARCADRPVAGALNYATRLARFGDRVTFHQSRLQDDCRDCSPRA